MEGVARRRLHAPGDIENAADDAGVKAQPVRVAGLFWAGIHLKILLVRLDKQREKLEAMLASLSDELSRFDADLTRVVPQQQRSSRPAARAAAPAMGAVVAVLARTDAPAATPATGPRWTVLGWPQLAVTLQSPNAVLEPNAVLLARVQSVAGSSVTVTCVAVTDGVGTIRWL